MPKPTLPAALANFVDLFNQGDYWESHEALEPEWRRTRSEFYHGLILYASAWVHQERGNRHGVDAQLAKAEPLLRCHAAGYLGIDVAEVLREAEDLRGHRPPARPVIDLNPARVRGDEPELVAAD
jgi:predicted metal-dependent hydrolase